MIGLVIYICYDKEVFKKSNDVERKEEENQGDRNEETDVEQELKDANIISELSNKTDILLANDKTGNSSNSKSWSVSIFRYGLLKNDLTSEHKKQILVDAIDWEKTTSEGNGSAAEETVKALYHNLFGEELAEILTYSSRCETISYDEASKRYHRQIGGCEGTGYYGSVRSYKSKFTIKNDETYVYLDLAHVISKDEEKSFVLYSDYDYDTEYLSEFQLVQYKNPHKLDLTKTDADSFKIDFTNYQDFSEYKFTFKKDDTSNYYFAGVEQIK